MTARSTNVRRSRSSTRVEASGEGELGSQDVCDDGGAEGDITTRTNIPIADGLALF